MIALRFVVLKLLAKIVIVTAGRPIWMRLTCLQVAGIEARRSHAEEKGTEQHQRHTAGEGPPVHGVARCSTL
ncbi:MAG: hypothetical protein CMB41_04865 [Euryarchaeota archaeon]|nr:hypothetical protein [Euryarchaeota archaeon]